MSKRKLFKIFLFLIGVVMISVTGYTAWKVNKDIDKTLSELNQPLIKQKAQKEISSLNEAEIDTSAWKIYRNEKYGIELRYPQNWFFQTDFDDSLSFEQNQDRSSLRSVITNYLPESFPLKGSEYIVPGDFLSISFSVIDRKFATQANGYINTINNIEKRSSSAGDSVCYFGKDKIIGNKNVKEIKTIKNNCEPTNEIIWLDKNKIVVFDSNYKNDSQRDIYYLIISTFRFTE